MENNFIIDDDKLEIKSEDIFKKFEELVNLIQAKYKYHSDNLDACNKEQDFILHKIQYFDSNDDELLTLTKQLKDIRGERTVHKHEILYMSIFKNYFKVTDFINKIKLVNNRIQRIKSGDVFTEETIVKYKIMKKICYHTEKERISLMSQFQTKYDRVVIDRFNHFVKAYNCGYTTSKNKI
jgi:hypothetical protein